MTTRNREQDGSDNDAVGPTVHAYDEASGWRVVSTPRERIRFRTEPCGPETGTSPMPCPWRMDAPVGQFPPSVFRHSARTAYELSDRRFGCHGSPGPQQVFTCAGFLLRGAQHNLSVRSGGPDEDLISDGGHELYPSYRAMAIANGVAPEDPALAPCRDYQAPPQEIAGTGVPPHRRKGGGDASA